MVNFTLLIAIFGASTGIVSFGWNIYKYLKDGTINVQVRGTVSMFTYPFGRVGEPHYSIEVVNKGKIPVYISSAGIRFKNSDKVMHFLNLESIHNKHFPVKLDFHESETFMVQELKILQREIKDLGLIPDYIFVKDSTGKSYKFRKLDILK